MVKSCGARRRAERGESGGSFAFGQRRPTAGHRVARQDRPYSSFGKRPFRPASGPSTERRWRQARGLAGHGGEHRAVFVYQIGLLSILGERARSKRLHLRTVRRELHGRWTCRIGRCALATVTESASALFEVTQPRVTCYRVGIRLNEPRMPALLVERGRPGFYLRVLQEGQVEAGDEIVQVGSRPGAHDGGRNRCAAILARSLP